MTRYLERLRYFASDAIDEWRRSPGTNLLATATLAAVLFLAGLLALGLENLSARLREWRQDARVEVYLEDDATAEMIQSVRSLLAATPGVLRVEHVTKDEALRRYREAFPSLAGLPSEIRVNPLPASLEAFLTAGPGAADLAKDLAQRAAASAGVEDVRYDQRWLDRLEGLLALARKGGAGLALVVFTALVLVMAGVLRLAVHAHHEEIETMLLVGATRALVRGPFLLAGAVQGSIAGVVALGLVEIARRIALARAPAGARSLVAAAIGSPTSPGTALGLVVAGIVVSIVGAGIAVRLSER